VNLNAGWRTVQASIPGVAHQKSGIECQDACATKLIALPSSGPVLALVVADGAGSATQSRAGAERACHALLDECATWLANAAENDWQPTVAASWLHSIQMTLTQQAADADLPVQEFACTLLGAIVAPDRALFLQIGDGAIVIGARDGYQPVFWPQSGQYPNETWFVTDENAACCLECVVLTEPIAEIALLTDGLQPLALHYQSRQAHEPFFRPMLQGLRDYPEEGSPEMLAHALEQFLDSPAINQRTHDDKTLVLASRLATTQLTADTSAIPDSESDPHLQKEKKAVPVEASGFQEDVGGETL